MRHIKYKFIKRYSDDPIVDGDLVVLVSLKSISWEIEDWVNKVLPSPVKIGNIYKVRLVGVYESKPAISVIGYGGYIHADHFKKLCNK